MTRKAQDRQRTYWRIKQQESRSKRSSQKIRRKKEKDRIYLNNKKTDEEQTECEEKPQNEEVTTPGCMSHSAVRKAAQRTKLPAKFADTLQYIMKASPNKRRALEEKGLIATKNDKCNRKIIEIMKEKLQNTKIKKSLLPGLKVM